MALSEVAVKQAKPASKPRKLVDGEGLYLYVAPTGTKTWRYDYRFFGRRQTLVIGRYPEVALKAARNRHFKARQDLEEGRNPALLKQEGKVRGRKASVNTLRAVSEAWFAELAPNRSIGWAKQIKGVLTNYIYPALGSRPVASVEPSDVLAMVKAIADDGSPRTAELARWTTTRIFSYAIVNLLTKGNPAREIRDAIDLPPIKHHAPLAAKELPLFMERVEAYGGKEETRLAIKLLLLTFVRKSEVAGARWSEFDLEAGEWRIPAERMKMKSPHFVPLSKQAVAVLKQLKKLTGHREFCFPHYGDPRDHMSNETFNSAFKSMGYGGKFSPHGIRATASTILNERGYLADAIERQLAHQPSNKIRAAYNQAQYIPERTKMMQDWATYLDGLKTGANVVHIMAKKAGRPKRA